MLMNFEHDRVHAAYGLSKPSLSPDVILAQWRLAAGTRMHTAQVKAILYRNDAFQW